MTSQLDAIVRVIKQASFRWSSEADIHKGDPWVGAAEYWRITF